MTITVSLQVVSPGNSFIRISDKGFITSVPLSHLLKKKKLVVFLPVNLCLKSQQQRILWNQMCYPRFPSALKLYPCDPRLLAPDGNLFLLSMLTAGSGAFYLLPCFSVQASQSCCRCLSSGRYVDWLPTQGCESQVTHHPCVCRVRIMARICSSAAGKSRSLPLEALSWEASAEHPGRNHAVHSKVGWHRGLLESLAQCRV